MELIVLRNGRPERVQVARTENGYEVHLGETAYLVDSAPTNGVVRSLVVEGKQYEVAVWRRSDNLYQVSSRGGLDEVEVLDPLTYQASQGAGRQSSGGLRKVEAYMPGRVVEVLVAEGDRVSAGQGLVVLEAMKMENEIQAERDGVVRRIYVSAGKAVEGGDPLFEVEWS